MKAQLGALVLGLLLTACNSGGDSLESKVLPSVPEDTGQETILMAGLWRVTDAEVVETNDLSLDLEIEPDGVFELSELVIVAMEGQPVSREALEGDTGMPLGFYLNQVDGQTVRFGFQISLGPQFMSMGLAGGCVDDDHILIEALVRYRMGATPTISYLRTRYMLERIVAPPAEVEPAAIERADGIDMLGGGLWSRWCDLNGPAATSEH